jgi:phosphatidylinositol alpha-mannosyltransferase
MARDVRALLDRRVNVVIVCPYSWSVPGGVANHVSSLAGRLRDRGHTVEILAPADTPSAEIRSLGRSVGIPYNGSVARVAFGPRVALRTRRAMKRVRPDVVHVHEPFAPSAGMLALLTAAAPVVATFHSSAPESRAYKAAAPILRPLWRKIAVKIAVSEEARRTVERAFGPGARVIPNGIALERFANLTPPAGDNQRILFIGRLEPRKGAGILLDAFKGVAARVPEASLMFVGEGPERKALEREAAGLDVAFHGRLEHEELAAALERSAVLCAPSLGGESFGIVLLEAMAAGRPVVASDIPGYAAVARDGIDALLVPPGDAAALASVLTALLRDPARARAMGVAGRERAARFSWDVVAGEVEQAYREAAGR